MKPTPSLLSRSVPRGLWPLLAGLLPLCLYLPTVRRGPMDGDPAELALCALRLGVAHPPGYPVHTWLGHVVVRLLPVDPATATSILSALCMACAAALLCLTARRLGAKGAFAALGAAVFAVNPRIWENAVRTELYALAVLLLSVNLFFLASVPAGRRSTVLVAGLLCGLMLAAYLPLAMVLPLLLLQTGGKPWRWQRPVVAGAIAATTALAMLLWVRLRWETLLDIGTPTPPDGLHNWLAYLLPGTASPKLAPSFLAQRALSTAGLLYAEMRWPSPFLIACGALGLLARRQWLWAVVLVGLGAVNTGYFMSLDLYDVTEMMLPTVWVLALLLALGIDQFWRWKAWLGVAGSLLAVAVVAFQVQSQWLGRLRDARHSPDAEFAERTLRELPAGTVIYAGWQRLTLMNYYHVGLKRRPDVRILHRGSGPNSGVHHYRFGAVTNWADHAVATVRAGTPAVVDKPHRIDPVFLRQFDVRALPCGWHLLAWPQPQGPANGPTNTDVRLP